MKTITPKLITQNPTLFYENFSNNNANWEITQNDKESAAITTNGYELKNTDEDVWHHFSVFPEIGNTKNIRMRCLLEIDPKSDLGQIGIIWGFDQKMSNLNRLCISTNGTGCSVLHFTKNHCPVFFRFFDPFFSIGKTNKVLFEVREYKNYYFFRINKKLAYVGHVSHFADEGNGFGIYIDPGVSASVKKIKISRTTSNTVFSLN